MFERFTDRARRVLVLAQAEARLLNHNYIGTEHLLLGLIREEEGVAAQALSSLGIKLEAVRDKIGQTVGPGKGSSTTGSPPFTPRSKKVLELSLREALQLGHNYIGTEHLLLGLVREGEGVAAQVLVDTGADLPRVRAQILQLLSDKGVAGPGQSGASLSFESKAARFWRRARTARPPSRPTGGRPRDVPLSVAGAVDLAFAGERLIGTVAEAKVDLALTVPAREGRAEGTFAAAEVDAAWLVAAAAAWHPDVPARLGGTCAGAPVRLLAWFHLGPDNVFDQGTVEGEAGRDLINVYIEGPDNPGDAGVYSAQGTFAGVGFSVRGTAGDQGQLEGAVAGRAVRLRVDRLEGDTHTWTVTGGYEGPLVLLGVLIGALLSFT